MGSSRTQRNVQEGSTHWECRSRRSAYRAAARIAQQKLKPSSLRGAETRWELEFLFLYANQIYTNSSRALANTYCPPNALFNQFYVYYINRINSKLYKKKHTKSEAEIYLNKAIKQEMGTEFVSKADRSIAQLIKLCLDSYLANAN